MKLPDLIFDSLHRFLRRLFVFSYRRHKTAWVLFGLLAGLSLYQLPNLKFLVMLGDLLDQDFETYDQFQDLNANFDEENQVSVMIRNKAGDLSFEQHCRVISWLTKVHLNQPRIARIYSTYGYRKIVESGASLRARPVLVPDCQDHSITQEDLKKQLAIIAASPSGRILTNKNQNDVFASFYLRNKEEGDRFGHFDSTAFEGLRSSFLETVVGSEPELEATWVGIGTYQYYLQSAYEQMNVINLITVVLAILSFKFFLGRWKSGFFFLLAYFLAMLLVYGFMGLQNFPVDSLSAAVPIMLLVSTLEDFVFMIFRYHRDSRIVDAYQKILIPSFYTSLTTCLGFFSLVLSDLTIIRRFGLICAVGAALKWAILTLLLPKLLVLWRRKTRGQTSLMEVPARVARVVDRLAYLRPPRWLALLALVPFLYVGLNVKDTFRIEDSPEAVFPKDHPVPRATEVLMNERGWKSEMSLVFPVPPGPETRRSLREEISGRYPEIVFTESFDDTKDFLMTDLRRKSSRDLMDSLLDSTDLKSRWEGRSDGSERILLYSSVTDVVRIDEIRREVRDLCAGRCYLASILVSYSEFGIEILETLTKSFGLSILLVLGLIFLLCRYLRINQTGFLLLSSIWGPMALCFLFIVSDFGIYFATSVVMSVLVGQSGDNAIHFIFSGKGSDLKAGLDDSSGPAIINLLLMMILCSSFLFSDFEGVRKIGLIMMSGLFLGWIGDVVILRGLLKN